MLKNDTPALQPNCDTENSQSPDENTATLKKRSGWLSNLFSNSKQLQSYEQLAEKQGDARLNKMLEEGTFSPEERAMLHNILRLREICVEDIMIPRAEIESMDIKLTLGQALGVFKGSGHSRIPVYNNTLDDPRGMIHIRDLLFHVTKDVGNGNKKKSSTAGKNISEKNQLTPKFEIDPHNLCKPIGKLNVIREVLFVPPSMLASNLMARMQARRIQMALVIDEYGGTDGLVSLEDIVEVIVGEIEDEHDEDDNTDLISQDGEGDFVVDARANLDEVATNLGPQFIVGEDGEDVDTIGGYIFSMLGRIPTRGEVINSGENFEFQILEVDPRRIRKIRIMPLRNAKRLRRANRQSKTNEGAP